MKFTEPVKQFTELMVASSPRGLNICVRQLGEAPLRPIVLLHGFLEQATAWDGVARRLHQATGRPIVVPDHRGHGRSEHCATTTYHFWDYVSDLDGVLDDTSEVDLVGHSMGGTIATLFAACRPQKVRTLTLVEGLGPPQPPDPVKRATKFLDAMRNPPQHKPIASLQKAADRVGFLQNKLDPDVAMQLATRITQEHGDGYMWAWDPLHKSRTPFGFDSNKHRRFLQALTMPVAVIDGEKSPLQLADLDERLSAIANKTRHTVADAGHNIHHDDPDALCRVILGHIDA